MTLVQAIQMSPKMTANSPVLRHVMCSGQGVGGPADDHDVDEVVEQLEEADRTVLDDVAVGPWRHPEAMTELG